MTESNLIRDDTFTIIKGPFSCGDEAFYLRDFEGKSLLARVIEQIPGRIENSFLLTSTAGGALAQAFAEAGSRVIARDDERLVKIFLAALSRSSCAKAVVIRMDFPFADKTVTTRLLNELDKGADFVFTRGFPHGLAVQEAYSYDTMKNAGKEIWRNLSLSTESLLSDPSVQAVEIGPEDLGCEFEQMPLSFKISSDADLLYMLRLIRAYDLESIDIATVSRVPIDRSGLSRFTGYTGSIPFNIVLRAVVSIANMATRWRMWRRRPRSIWGVAPILTLRTKSKADRMLGVRADSVVFTTYRMTADFDYVLGKWRDRAALVPLIGRRGFHWIVFILSLFRYDFFHYFCNYGLLPEEAKRAGINPLELRLISAAGKRLFTYTYGADVRTREKTQALGKYHLCMNCPTIGAHCVCSDKTGARNITRIRKHARAMMAMGDMLAYVPQAVNTHFWPLDVANTPYIGAKQDTGRPLRVVHSPNHAYFKGTVYLQKAVERLQTEGREIELDIVSGLSNREALRRYAEADIVAEQFTAGFHGYTALEAMALGKPVMCYLRDEDTQIGGARCPIINVNPESLYEALKRYIGHRDELEELGEKGRAYMERYYTVEAFAVRLGEMYCSCGHLPIGVKRDIRRAIDKLSNSTAHGKEDG